MACRTQINSISTRCLLLMAVLFHSSQSFESTESICHGNKLDNKLERTTEKVISITGKLLDLKCPTLMNTSSDNRFTWFYERENRWIEYPWNNATFYFIYFKNGTNNGTLRLNYPFFHDSGHYTCCSYNQDSHLSVVHQFNVELIDCAKRKTRVIFEKPPEDRTVELGANITLPPCEAYFGCLDEGVTSQRTVYLQYNGAKVTNEGRFQLTNYKSQQSVTVGSKLTIHGIRESDLEHPYICVVNSSQAWSLQLKEKVGDKTETVLEDYWYPVIVIVVIFLIIMVVLFRYPILLGFKLIFCHISSRFKGKIVGILHDLNDEEAKTFVNNTLKAKLSGYGFTCSIIQHVPLGEQILESSFEKVSACDAVISVMKGSTSNDVAGDGMFHYIMNGSLSDKVNVFCILLHQDLNKKELDKTVKLVKRRYNGVRILKWQTKPSKRLIKFPTCLSVNNFWCKVRLKLADMSKKERKETSRDVTSTYVPSNINSSETCLSVDLG